MPNNLLNTSSIYKKIGSFYEEGKGCTFYVWAPFKKKVQLIITKPKAMEVEMQPQEYGYWFAFVEGLPQGATYFYKLENEEKWLPDPASISQPEGVHGASQVIDRNFSWTDDEWYGIDFQQYILYELHVGTFSTQNNFEGVVSKLEYLHNLGITAIELMPVAQFPGNRNWGYDGVFPFAVQNSYGGVNELKKLVNAAHGYGMAVVLDVVYNHLGPEGNYLPLFAPYLTDKYHSFWGKALNYDDAWCDGVRNYMIQNALMWLDEFHIDALRLDAVHAIYDFGAVHFIKQLKEAVHQLQQRLNIPKYLIAEIDLNDVKYINSFEKGGYALDAQWVDEFHHALHALLTREVNGYYEDFGSFSHLVKAYQTPYVYDGVFSPHRKKIFGSSPIAHPYHKFVVFAQNHDQVGNRLLGDRLTKILSFEQLKLSAALVLLSPYIPLLFMGEEYGETNPFLFFTSHSDKQLIENVQKGRKEEFAYFNFQGDFPDPQSEATFQQSILSWNLENTHHALLLRYYRQLITFRKTLPALQQTQRHSMNIWKTNETDALLIAERVAPQQRLLLLFNCSAHPNTFQLAENKKAHTLFYSANKEWKVSNEEETTFFQHNLSYALQPFSAAILEFIE